MFPKISQSIINDLCEYDMCPQVIKFKYFDGARGSQSDVMFRGNYFEYFVLGDTRDHNFPQFEMVNRKNLKPTASASKKVKQAYLFDKAVDFTNESDLDEIIAAMPEDRTEGNKCAAQLELDELVAYAVNVLKLMGITPEKGQSQVQINAGELQGHLDHINNDFANPSRKAVYDLKYTETKESDKWNGWQDLTTNGNHLTQATHYIKLYHAQFGEWVPFYFLVFGKTKWVKVFKVNVSEEAMEAHDRKIELCVEDLKRLQTENFPALPKFNKCAKCDFMDMCDFRKTTPEVEEVNL